MLVSHGQATVDFNNSGPILESNEPPSYTGDSQISLDRFYPLPPHHVPGPPFFPLFMQESVCNSDNYNEFDVHTLQNAQRQHSATFVGDENAPTGPVDFQAADKLQPYHTIHMQEQMALHNPRNIPMSFPTLETFSPPVDGLPQWPQSQPSYFQYSAIAQAYSHPAHNGFAANYETDLDAGRYPESSNVMGPDTLTPWQSNAPCPLQQGDFGEYARPMGLPNGAIIDSQYPSVDASWETFSFIPYNPATPPKRKTSKAVKTGGAKRRGMYDRKREKRGLFGKYALANAKATMMVKPIINRNPTDISRRRTHDAYGNLLRTRNYGAMEIDDSHYGRRSTPIAEDLPAGLMCVRECEWTDQPCGLYVETTKKRMQDHLLYWHGVRTDSPTPCKFKDCSDAKPMKSLGRHIITVHYTTSSECVHCGEVLSRGDAVTRHRKWCESIQSAADHAFEFKPPKTILRGYIVPTK